MFDKKIKAIALLLWATGIFLLSSEPADQSSERSNFILSIFNLDTSNPDSIATFIVRKSAHIFMFFVLGILIHALLRSFAISPLKVITYSVLFSFCYAVFDELHQTFVPGRSGELRDVLLDTIGASLGILIAHFIYRSSGKAKKEVGS